MKKFISLLFFTVLFASGSLWAEGNAKPYLGLGYKYQHMNGKDQWKRVLPDKFHSGGIFFGLKFQENFGFEFGVEQSRKKTRTSTFSGGDSFFNMKVPNNGTLTSKTKVRVQNTYIDLNGYWSIRENWDLLGTLGLGFAKAKVYDNGSFMKVNNVVVNAHGTTSRKVNARRKAVARIGVGAEYKCNNWGIRGKLLWENTSRLRVQGTQNPVITIPEKYFKNSLGFGLGVSYYFKN